MLVGPTIVDAGDKRVAAVQLFDALGNPVTAGMAPATAVLTSVPGVITSVVLVPANANRKRVVVYNDAGKNVRIAFAPAATATAFTYLMASKTHLDLPLGDYTGDISAIWEGAGGNARVTEISA